MQAGRDGGTARLYGTAALRFLVPLHGQDRQEAVGAVREVGADAELPAISWRATPDDGKFLMLREYNTTGKAAHRPQ